MYNSGRKTYFCHKIAQKRVFFSLLLKFIINFALHLLFLFYYGNIFFQRGQR